MIKDSMLNEELRHKELGITIESSTLVNENRGRSTHKNSHMTSRINQRGSKSGHMENKCQKLKAKNDGRKRDQFRSRSGDDENEHIVAIASDEGFVNFTSQGSNLGS
jgi:hypothetical protein